MSRNFTAIQVEKISNSLAATFMIGLENGLQDFQKDSKQSQQIFNAAEQLFNAESSRDVHNIVFESKTISDLVKEQKKHAEGRRNHRLNDVDPSLERSIDFAKELENMRANFGEKASNEGRIRIDPISKKPIRIPVKNLRCNHIYDKHVILEAIQMNSRLRCPFLGCNNKKIIPSDLVEMVENSMEDDNIIDIDL